MLLLQCQCVVFLFVAAAVQEMTHLPSPSLGCQGEATNSNSNWDFTEVIRQCNGRVTRVLGDSYRIITWCYRRVK